MINYLPPKHNYALKFIICMKLMIFLTCVSMHVTANVYSQKVSLQLKNAALTNVLKEIENQSGVRFVYSPEFLNNKKSVNINVREKSVASVLSTILRGSNLEYSESGNKLIIISPKQEIVVTGTVKNENGEPLSGATVRVKGTTVASTTDINGSFSIRLSSGGGAVVISYLGYADYQIDVNSSQNLNIKLTPNEATGIDEIIVVGYGTQSKSKVSDAVVSVKMDEIMRDRPVSSAGAALEGALPGLNISIGSGEPGTKPNFNIRGWASINGGNPLYVVDNIPMEDISLLNPADFESVTVLKDASASVLYGARAAFGVVLITTKKGSLNQPTSFEYAYGYSPTSISKLPKKHSVRDWVNLMQSFGQQDWWANNQSMDVYERLLDAYDADPSAFPANGIVREGGNLYSLKNHDQFASFFEGGAEQYHNFTASGGSDKLFFRSSLRYVDEDGTVVGPNDSYKRWSSDNSFTSQLTSTLNFQANIKYNNFNRTEPGSGYYGPFYSMVTQPGFTPTGYDDVQTQNGIRNLPYNTQNNLAELQNPKMLYGDQLRLGTKLVFKPVNNLTINGEYAFEKTTDNESRANNNPLIETIHAEYFINQPMDPNAQSYTSYYKNIGVRSHQILNLYAKYVFTQLENHNMDIMLGTNQEYINYEFNGASRPGVLSMSAPSLGSSSGVVNATDGFYRNAISGYFGQFHYDYKGKYILQLGARYDGSSRFPSESRFGFFPTASIAWNMMNESFMSPLADVFSTIKPRLSYGSIGNQVTKDNYYPAIAQMNSGNASWLNSTNNTPFVQISSPGLVSSTITWEDVTTLGYGLDVLALRNRLNFSFDYFTRSTTGMVAPARPLPAILGTPAPQTNAADLETKGFEISLGWTDRAGEFKYAISANLSDDRGVITKYDNPQKSIGSYYTGQNLGEIWGYESKGLYSIDHFSGLNADLMGGQLTDAAKAAGWVQFRGKGNPNPGDMAYVDQNGDGIIDWGNYTVDNAGDLKVIGNTSHRYRFGLNGNVSYKNFDFSFMLNGVGKRQFWADNAFTLPWKDRYFDILPSASDFWTKDNTDARIFRIYRNAGETQWASRETQSRYLLNGAYLRIKNLAFGYTIPNTMTDRTFLKKVRVFISGENLFTFDHLPDGMDPGTDLKNDWAGGTYPYIKKFNFGVNVNF
ncbi:SusC/RagA family TonB-linked outer membrane protein [Sphingobacterium bovistauri]|uniref:SusC/RagA family TonB-linked outer membrane protein n=1 Tax=Sphingobacterium bovistauri TaxID=2781959 RepID=A0ABS7Z3D3_9SPHI|nr:SusC/RagA family TonB-linked outer membrane protein [Sphingobacterium bovistauri]MCA5004657.1 SusC/RagA family TonB-linked outer membrane protein [Sphingobacterium bovistauri]